MPCAMPPCTWPSTSIGLTCTPKSLIAVYRTISTTPVSGSISTSATWQPFGHDDVISPRDMGDVQRARRISGQRDRLVTKHPGEFHQPHTAIGSRDRESAFGKFDVRHGSFKHDGSKLLAAFDDEFARFQDRGAARGDRARSAGSAAEHDLVAVALQQSNAIEGNSEPRTQYLRERRRVALSIVERAGNDRDRAVRLEPYAAHFLVRRRGAFEILPHTAPAQPAARATLCTAARKSIPIRGVQGAIEHSGEIAAVVRLT